MNVQSADGGGNWDMVNGNYVGAAAAPVDTYRPQNPQPHPVLEAEDRKRDPGHAARHGVTDRHISHAESVGLRMR